MFHKDDGRVMITCQTMEKARISFDGFQDKRVLTAVEKAALVTG